MKLLVDKICILPLIMTKPVKALFYYSNEWLRFSMRLLHLLIVMCTHSSVHKVEYKVHISTYVLFHLFTSIVLSVVSVLFPNKWRFFHVRAMSILNLLNVFQMFHSLWYSGGNYSINLNLKLLVLLNFSHLRYHLRSRDVVSSVADFKKILLTLV